MARSKKTTKKKVTKTKTKPKRAKRYVSKRKTLKKKLGPLNLRKPKHNPIIQPSPDLAWQSKATFNPTAIHHDGKVHIIYRAIGDNDVSVLGYANSLNGTSIAEGHPEAVYTHRTDGSKKRMRKKPPLVPISSGGGWSGGCEDPRLTALDDRAYLLYTAFDGWGSMRTTLTSISLDDFVSKRWRWDEPVAISFPGERGKNWVLFPEKIHGQYAILHAISPKIMIDYVRDMDEFDGHKFIKSLSYEEREKEVREKGIRGVGPAPIKTKYGWLVLYHAIEKSDPGKYKLWAMILDLDDPTKVLYRSKQAILEPDEEYENVGFKWGVVYACGAVVKDGELFVYYGGADKVSCVASVNLAKFLHELIKMKEPKLSTRKVSKV